MTALMSENLKNIIQEQIAHEIYNANLYLYIAGFLKNKGLDNLAKVFEKQRDEELEHSLLFFNLLTDLNAYVIIPEIEEVSLPLISILDISKAFLNREILTTNSINEIKTIAIQEANPVVEEMARRMIAKQQHEYEEATSFADKAELMKEWWQCVLWDIGIG